MRKQEIIRKTKETDITLSLNLDGKGISNIDTNCGFLNHMLDLFSFHSNIDLTIKAIGDIEVDYHHLAEDLGIVLGDAINKALENNKNINRYGSFILPMDDALILCALDFSNRSYLNFDCEITSPKVGDFDTELIKEFFIAFTRTAKINLHFKKLAGENTHHIIEGIFKSFAKAIKIALEINKENKIPSTKGVL